MKVKVNQETCIASGQCSRSAPNVFGHSDDGFVELLIAHPPAADQEGAWEAEDLCPSGSITVEDDDEQAPD